MTIYATVGDGLWPDRQLSLRLPSGSGLSMDVYGVKASVDGASIVINDGNELSVATSPTLAVDSYISPSPPSQLVNLLYHGNTWVSITSALQQSPWQLQHLSNFLPLVLANLLTLQQNPRLEASICRAVEALPQPWCIIPFVCMQRVSTQPLQARLLSMLLPPAKFPPPLVSQRSFHCVDQPVCSLPTLSISLSLTLTTVDPHLREIINSSVSQSLTVLFILVILIFPSPAGLLLLTP